jgi:hypothetical protein
MIAYNFESQQWEKYENHLKKVLFHHFFCSYGGLFLRVGERQLD